MSINHAVKPPDFHSVKSSGTVMEIVCWILAVTPLMVMYVGFGAKTSRYGGGHPGKKEVKKYYLQKCVF